MDDHVSVIGDWVPPNPSPRTFFKSILGDDFASRSFSELLGDNEHHQGIPSASSEKMKDPMKRDDDTDDAISGDRSNSFSIQKPNSYKSLAERMAARAGFNAPTVNTTRTNLSSPEVRSPYLTIPPGLSPTTLLDSPVFLSNSLIQPSPTTGKFSFDPSNGKSSMFPAASARDKDNGVEDVNTSLFAFKPHVEVNPSHFRCTSNKETTGNNPKQKFPSIEVSVQSECSPQLRSPEATEGHPQNLGSFHHWAELPRHSTEGNTDGNHQFADPVTANDEGSPELDDQQDAEGDQRSYGELNSTIVNAASSEDGYCWRKYGQKQVKGSECPRSYYKCTHPNCQVKKKVERSHEGHITEIIYKGAHNHPKPPQNRRSTVGSSNLQSDVQLDIAGHGMTGSGVDSIWARLQGAVATGCPDQKHDSMNATSSASGRLELFDPSTSMQTEKAAHPEAANILDVSCTLSNDEDEDDRGTHGSVSLGCDGEGDETESKRRKIEATEMGGVARAIREPRVVVQTTSEVDILDDGYRWRKYGQKVVKGNPNPRSYYKCTNTGCTVRKHVERASHDLKSVITTYEGKHNHDVPAARNSNHVSSGASNTMPASAALSRTRPDPSQVHENMTRFDGPVSLSSCMLPGRQQFRPLPGFSFRASQSGMSNLSMAGRQSELLAMPAHLHQYLEQQQRQANEAGSFMMPKGEPVYESTSELGSFIRHEKMNRLPLGPQTETETHNGWSFHACI